jgi:eukaryotic-like serine/threonine-protein kinase
MKWKINTGKGIEAPAMIQNEIAYVGNYEGKVFAIEVATGRTLWTYETEGQIMGAANYWEPGSRWEEQQGGTGAGQEREQEQKWSGKWGVVVVGSYDYYLHGIDAATGKGLWKYEADNFLNGAPAIYDGVAVFGGCDGLLAPGACEGWNAGEPERGGLLYCRFGGGRQGDHLCGRL